MKKYLVKSAAVTVICVGALSLSTSVFAAGSTETNAHVSIVSGGLSIDPLAEIDFGTVTKNGDDCKVSDRHSSQLVVNDNRGTTASGWHLTAKLEEKKQGNSGLDGMTLHLKPAKPQGSTEKATFSEVDLNTTAQDIVTLATGDFDLSTTVTTANLNATLFVPKNIAAASYSGVIIWNAVDASPEL
ncbi:WxL domain-containing protein [Enterococcus faecalis]